MFGLFIVCQNRSSYLTVQNLEILEYNYEQYCDQPNCDPLDHQLQLATLTAGSLTWPVHWG